MTSKHLSNEALFRELNSRPGLIPAHLNGDALEWTDMEHYHFYEGFFHQSVSFFSALKQNNVVSFTSGADILEDERVLTDYVYPSGFIFHPGRCGSTLLVKTLNRLPENLVISEAQPLNAFWLRLVHEKPVQSEIIDRHIRMFRNLLLAMVRRREPVSKHGIVKFTSFNIRFFDLIHAAFPDVPSIFLRRPMPEIVASWQKRAPGWLLQEPETIRMLTGCDGTDLKAVAESFLQMAEGYSPHVLMPVAYETLRPENLPHLLDHFNITAGNEQLRLMQKQFQYDAKAAFRQQQFKR